VRERTFIAAALVTGLWAVACSKPDSEISPAPDRKSSETAPINLVSTPAPDAPVVSNLEAGRDPRLALPRPLVRKPAELPVRGSGAATVAHANGEASHAHAAAAAAALVPTMRVTTTSVASVAPDVVPAALPPAATVGGGVAIGMDASGSDGSGRYPAVVSRGPAIIIRGGMGSARDDCDLHRRPGFGAFGGGGPVAVNRMAPPLGRSMGGPMIANPAGLRIR
jgi:hypothetical protein